jgi:hypothetical protein
MIFPSVFFNMGKYADLIDTVVCTLFGTVVIFGAAWFLVDLGNFWPPVFLG